MQRWARLVTAGVLAASLVSVAAADVNLTYLGAFRAFPGNPSIYGGDLAFYPAGNGGAGSLFISRDSTSGSGKEIWEITIPELVITTDLAALNTATTMNSLDTSIAPYGLVWRSTDDRLYYSTGATGYQAMRFRSINRDGTDESELVEGPGWHSGGYALTQIPDDWAAAYADGKNLLTVAPVNGAKTVSVDPWNATVTDTVVMSFGSPNMTGYDYGDNYNGIAWVEVGEARDLLFSGSDLPGPNATIWFFRVADIENKAIAQPQPYKIEVVQDRIFSTSKSLYGLTYDADNQVLYSYEGAYGGPTIVHAWRVEDATHVDLPPTAITDLQASDPTLTSITLTWTAPLDDHGVSGKAASYDVRYSTSPIDETNWETALQATGEPTPSTPGLPEMLVVNGLTPGTVYYFAVKSADEAGNVSDLSNVVSLKTVDPDITPPAAITDLAATNVQSTQLLLTWSSPGDDGLAGQAVAYEIRYSTAAIDEGNFAAATLISHSLTPKAPGQPENLLVTGLSPSTTYYFAIKTADEVPNWSAISNVPSATMQAPDNTAPAAVTDLAAGGTDALSATLTWTASGDDGTSGTAASYEIRYSTAPINEANWVDATLAANVLAPKPAGESESFTIIGLQPSTVYYFALKVKDEEGNTSGLSNVAVHTTGTLGDLPVVTTMQIVEKAGVTTANYPVTLSMALAKGDVAENVTVRAGGLVLPTQTDVKVRWEDGSVRHALVSFVLPQLAADQTVDLEILAGGPNYNSGWVTKEQLLASDFEALMSLLYGSLQVNVSARQMLQGIAEPEYWIKGGICSELVIQDWASRVYGQLNVSYRVRVYPGAGAIRVSVVVDNTWIDARANITYSFTLSLGRSNPQVVFSKTDLTHFHSARWHKVFWQGNPPPTVEIRYNLPYWIKGGFLPRYDTSITVPASTIASTYNSWNSSAHDIMEGAGLTKYMPTTGGRSEIAPYPLWTSRYLLSMDYRLAEVVLNYGDLSGTVPMHQRESDPARSFYCRPVKVDDRPTIWTGSPRYEGIAPADRYPEVIGDTETPWTVDLAHQGSLAYVPYLISGDRYYLEEMHFWACFDLGDSNSGYRGGTQCWLVDQLRGNAWAFRNIVDAAAMTPDDWPEKDYLNEKIANNITRWNNAYVVPTMAGAFPTVRYFATSSGLDSSHDPAHCSAVMSSWQTEYMLWSLIHAKDMGYPTHDLVNWAGRGLIDRFTDWPGWNRYRGTVYVFPAKGKDANGNSVDYQTWAEVNDGFINKVGPSAFTGEYPDSYVFTSWGVMALVTHLPNGRATWDWLDGELAAFMSGVPSDPRWAFAPSPFLPGDIDEDGHVNVFDIFVIAESWNTAFGDPAYNPAADVDGDFAVNVFDIFTLAENWNR